MISNAKVVKAYSPTALPWLLLGVLLSAQGETVAVIHAFAEGLDGVRAASSDIRLSIGRDAGLPNDAVLIVDYPAPTGNPAGRDVQCDAQATDWSGGRAIARRST
jgi:hypothetical protein